MWAYHRRAKIDFSRPGKPTDNCHIEMFNGLFRDECFTINWVERLSEAKAIVDAWLHDYNESRSHSALKDFAPAEFARQIALSLGLTGPVTPENSLSDRSKIPRADRRERKPQGVFEIRRSTKS
ncbi:integrase core domain-containing protein [Burkholderia gladioli]|uniref:integrase core domain-containing protein n=1 Tax=Burkholderia gladioli TaxID=28095 RepID=UPI0016411780